MRFKVVIGVVQFKNKILLMKRTSTRKHSPNKWQPPSGFLEENEDPEIAVLREVKEETGLSGKIIKKGENFDSETEYGKWFNIPFLISVDSDRVKITEEHSEYKWIDLKELNRFDLLEGVIEDLKLLSLI